MNKKIEKIKKFRQFLLAQITGMTAEQMNKIPEGYNNNIIWNLAHLICAQQSLCYMRAGQSIIVEEKYFLPYTTNTKPDVFKDDQEIENQQGFTIQLHAFTYVSDRLAANGVVSQGQKTSPSI